jgi:hypothetical protein
MVAVYILEPKLNAKFEEGYGIFCNTLLIIIF